MTARDVMKLAVSAGVSQSRVPVIPIVMSIRHLRTHVCSASETPLTNFGSALVSAAVGRELILEVVVAVLETQRPDGGVFVSVFL